MSDAVTNALLISINEQLGDMREKIGKINSQLEAGSAKHKTFEQKLDIIDHRTDIIENKVIDAERILTPAAGPTLIDRVVTLEVWQENQRGERVTSGTARVVLPRGGARG